MTQSDKNQKTRRQKVFRFYCWQHISAHISGHGCDKLIRFTLLCIIYGCAYSQIKISKIGDKKFSVFTAGSIFWPISRVMGVINEFGFRCFASFTDALTAIYKSEKSALNFLRFYCWQHISAHISGHGCDK